MEARVGTKILIIAALLCAALPCFALDGHEALLPQLSEAEWQRMFEGGYVDRDTLGGGSISQMAPAGSEARRQALRCEASQGSFTVTSSALIPYPARWLDLSPRERQLELLNTLRRISTQKGITYISYRAGNKPKELFSESYYISDPSDKKSRIDDPVADSLPEAIQSYAYQKDTSFGGNIYLHDFKISDEEIFLRITNVTPMKVFGIFKAVDAGKLALSLGAYQMEEGIYVFSMAEIADMEPQVTVLFITVDLPSAFRRRTTAIRKWFEGQIALADMVEE